MAVKKGGLGRGLDSLIAPRKSNTETSKTSTQIKTPSKEQPSQMNSFENKEISINVSASDADLPDKTESTSTEDTSERENIVLTSDNNIEIDDSISSKLTKKKTNKKETQELLIDIDDIEPNRMQPRKQFHEDALAELADSIKQVGIIQPLVVQKNENNIYEIIAGERRWRAARIAGLKKVPVIVKDYSPEESVEIALIENIQREDLNPIEEAHAFERLIQEYGLKQDEAAQKVSKSRSAVTNALRLLKLDARVQQMVMDDMLTSGHARALVPIEDPQLQYQTALKVFDTNLSVRETEKLVKNTLHPETSRQQPSRNSKSEPEVRLALDSMEEKMKARFGTKVSIKEKTNNKGKIEIEYYSMEELERIIDLIIEEE